MVNLVSRLFRDSNRLKDAANTPLKHVTQGSQGDHVRLIHIYLYRSGAVQDYLDDVFIRNGDPFSVTVENVAMKADFKNKFYSDTTESVVKFYKANNGIINKSYQKTADGIVGQMTIKDFDDKASKFAWLPDQSTTHPPIPGPNVDDG